MNIEEFKKRTEEFLTADEIAGYDAKFEPAYMAVQGIHKDDFCAILENPIARRFVIAVSEAVVDLEARLKDAAREKSHKTVAEADCQSLIAARNRAESVAAKYRTTLELIAIMAKSVGAAV